VSEYGYHYNVIQTNGEGWHVLTLMEDYQQHGYESFGTMVDAKTGVLCILMRKPMTAEEARQKRMKWAIDQERREKKARSK